MTAAAEGARGPATPAWAAAQAAVRGEADWAVLRDRIVGTAIVPGAQDLVIDFRRLLTDGDSLARGGRLMWAMVRPFAPAVLVGPGFGAAPLLFATVLAAQADGVALRVLMVRDQRKGHNQKRWVEGGAVPAGAPAVLIDDVMIAGSALGLVEAALVADRIAVELRAVALFFDMWQPLGARQIAVSRLPVVSLFRRHDVGMSRDCFDAKPPLMKGTFPDFVTERLWWRLALNRPTEVTDYPHRATPAVADDAVFAADDRSRLWRHAAADGTIEWRLDSVVEPPKGIVQRLVHAEGSLVYGCYDGTVTRADARDGRVIWRWRQDSSVHATPWLDLPNGRLFVNTEQAGTAIRRSGHLQALDWATGRALWRVRHDWWPPGSPVHDPQTDLVVAPCNDRTLVAVEAAEGAFRWRARTEGLVRGRPALAEGRVFVATESGHLQAFDVGTGRRLWSSRYGQGAVHQFVHVADGVVYAVDGRWHLLAFDVRDGRVLWLTRQRSPVCWGPVAFGRWLVLLSRGGEIAVVEPAARRKVWEGRIEGRYRQPPAVGVTTAGGILAAAGNGTGLVVHRIHPHYLEGA